MKGKKEILFEKSYEKYAKLLLKIIYSYIKNYDDCQDILQEVFYRLLYKSPRFKSDEHQKRWLIKTAINLSKDYIKSFWQSKTEGLSDERVQQDVSENENVDELIMQLPDKYREVIVLHYICGYNVAETGGFLGIGESAVKMRLCRARQMLRLEMEEQ